MRFRMYRVIAGREAGSNVGGWSDVGRVQDVIVDERDRSVLWYTVKMAFRRD
jgi:hypothetical protein